MATNIHPELTDEEVHTPYRQVFANDAARTGDATVYDATDLYKKAYQVDSGEEYVLTAIGPTTWTLVSGGGGAPAETVAPETFVFRPAGVADGNVYTDFGLLYTDLSAASGHKVLVLDDSGTSTVAIPNGTYDLAGCKVTNGKVSSEEYGYNKTTVTWGTTTRLENVAYWENLIFNANTDGLGTPIVYTKNISVIMDGCIFIAGQPSATVVDPVVISIPDGVPQIDIYWEMNGSTIGYGSPDFGSGIAYLPDPVMEFSSGGDDITFNLRGSYIGGRILSGGVSDTISQIYLDPGSTFAEAQPGFSGTIGPFLPPAKRVGIDPDDMELNVLRNSTFDVQEAIKDLDEAFAPVERALGPAGMVYTPFDGSPTTTITFPPAPVDFIMKKLYMYMGPNGGLGVTDPIMYYAVADILIDGFSIMHGVGPARAFDPKYDTETPVFNETVLSGDVITVILNNPPTASGGGIFINPLITYNEGSFIGLRSETYLGLDPTIHTGPPVGAALIPGTGGTEASAVITVNTAPLTGGTNEIVFNRTLDAPVTLTGVAGARTPGSNDFNYTIGTVAGLATEIAAAINDGANIFDTTYTATANTPGPGDVTIEHFGGEIGNFSSIDVTVAGVGEITPASQSMSGGLPEIITLTFEPAPQDMILKRLYTTFVGSGGTTFLDSALELQSIKINAGPNVLAGRISTAYTSNGPGDQTGFGAGKQQTLNLEIPIVAADVVTIELVNNLGASGSGGITAAWVAELVF